MGQRCPRRARCHLDDGEQKPSSRLYFSADIVLQMPSLPLHLATLSKLLESRMQLYQPLLSLSGRLDLALAQIAMRRLALEQQANSKAGDHGVKYVEGESDDESDDEVRVEVGDGEGDVEDIDMRVG